MWDRYASCTMTTSSKTALVTGAAGQGGLYLCRHLARQGY